MKSMWFDIRKKAGLTQKQVAEKFGVSANFIYNIENGISHMPDKYKEFYMSLSKQKNDYEKKK